MTTQSRDISTTMRALSSMDPDIMEGLVGARIENMEASGLSGREYALVKIAGLVGIDASPASYAWQVGFAKENGVTDEEILGVLVALSSTVGHARIVTAATELAFAMGFADDDEP